MKGGSDSTDVSECIAYKRFLLFSFSDLMG